MMDWIHLRQLSFPCIIGLLKSEQCTEQRVTLDISLGLDITASAQGSLEASVDYVVLAPQLQFIAQQSRWRLLESMGMALVRFILLPPAAGEGRAAVDEARVSITKPQALGGGALPTLEMSRARAAIDIPRRTIGSRVEADVLLETRHTGAYRVTMEPQGEWELPAGAAGMVICGALRCGQHTIGRGEPVPTEDAWVVNHSDRDCALVLITHPPLPPNHAEPSA
jgi:FolB domain-containing protein